MGYLTVKQLSEKWEISERRIIKLCKENRINGAIKNGMLWMIPEDTIKPSDKRTKVAKYINTQKRIMIVNINNDIGYQLIPLLKKEGFIVEGIYQDGSTIEKDRIDNVSILKTRFDSKNELEKIIDKTGKYYDGLVFIEAENVDIKILKNKEWFITEFAKKMNCESSIVLVNYLQNVKEKLEEKLANKLKQEIGLRINAINIDVPINNNILIYSNEIAEDVLELLTKFKNTTGIAIKTDGGYLEFNKERQNTSSRKRNVL